MESLLYFLLAALIFYLMMSMGRWLYARRDQAHPGQYRRIADEVYWTPPRKDRDPVCRKVIQTQGAKSCVHQDKAYYFCSRECREAFEAAPGIYVTEFDDTEAGSRKHAHV